MRLFTGPFPLADVKTNAGCLYGLVDVEKSFKKMFFFFNFLKRSRTWSRLQQYWKTKRQRRKLEKIRRGGRKRKEEEERQNDEEEEKEKEENEKEEKGEFGGGGCTMG